MRFIQSGHGIYYSQCHVCFCTKYRRKVLNPGVSKYLRKILPKITRSMAGVRIDEIGIDMKMKDHVHLIMCIPPKYSTSKVVANIKAKSTSLLIKKFRWLNKAYWNEIIVWFPGFFYSTVGVSEKMIREYVKSQGRTDLGQLQLELKL